jgi:hypothetical protein
MVEADRESSVIYLSAPDSSTVFLYKYFKESSQKDLMTAWVKWKLPGNVYHQFTSRDSHYAVLGRSGGFTLVKLSPDNDYYDDDVSVEARVRLPQLYVTKSEQKTYRADTTASTTIHRLKLNTGETNYYIADIKRFGKDDYQVEFEQTIMDGYVSDEQPVTTDREETIQLYERNTNLDITLTSPIGPFQLYSMRWEGDYNNRYYQRV